VWYLIPAVLLLGRRRRSMAMLCPVVPPAKKASYRYECYREAWNLLTWSRAELAQLSDIVPIGGRSGGSISQRNAETR